MDQNTISELQERLAATLETLKTTEERAVAGQLALEMIHEIKNPLEALGHLIYLTSQQADHSEEISRYMRLAQEQVIILSSITSRTLDVARTSPVPKPIDLVAIAEAALRIHQRAIESKKIHLVKDLPQDLVVRVYSGEMLQVLSNLIVNALDALPTDGSLFLRLRRRSREVHLVIADSGHGIPEKYRSEIFKPFFTTKQERGNGLGLALSKKIIDRHSGKISIRSSVRPGKSGTIFKISIPG